MESISCPLTPKSQSLISPREFTRMLEGLTSVKREQEMRELTLVIWERRSVLYRPHHMPHQRQSLTCKLQTQLTKDVYSLRVQTRPYDSTEGVSYHEQVQGTPAPGRQRQADL